MNELYGKAALSPAKQRLTEHLSAFANQPGGGFLVFGVDSAGTPAGLDAKVAQVALLIPPPGVVDDFDRTTIPMAEQILVLQRQCRNLRATRNLLLPKLLSADDGIVRMTASADAHAVEVSD